MVYLAAELLLKRVFRAVKIGVEERTKMTMRNVNYCSKKKAKVGISASARYLLSGVQYYSRIFITEYAQVIRMLGNGRLEARAFDGTKRLAHIRGKLRKKVWYIHAFVFWKKLRLIESGSTMVTSFCCPSANSKMRKGTLS